MLAPLPRILPVLTNDLPLFVSCSSIPQPYSHCSCDVLRKPRRQLSFGYLGFDAMCFGLSKACLHIVNINLTNSKYRELSFKQYAYVKAMKRPVCIISFAELCCTEKDHESPRNGKRK